MFEDPADTLVVRDLEVAADLHGQRVELSVDQPGDTQVGRQTGEGGHRQGDG